MEGGGTINEGSTPPRPSVGNWYPPHDYNSGVLVEVCPLPTTPAPTTIPKFQWKAMITQRPFLVQENCRSRVESFVRTPKHLSNIAWCLDPRYLPVSGMKHMVLLSSAHLVEQVARVPRLTPVERLDGLRKKHVWSKTSQHELQQDSETSCIRVWVDTDKILEWYKNNWFDSIWIQHDFQYHRCWLVFVPYFWMSIQINDY